MYIGSHRLRHCRIHHKPGSSLWFTGILRFTAQSMLLFFLLIYFFSLGFSPVAVFSYGLAFNVFSLIFNHWVIGYLIAVIGPHRMIALSNIGLIVFAFALYSFPAGLVFLYLLAALQALSYESYFLSQHVYLAATATGTDAGYEVGHQFSVEPMGTLIGPLLGGLVAWLWSVQAVNFVAGFILVASGILAFVFHDKTVNSRRYYSHSKIWQIYRWTVKNWRNPLMIGGVISFDFIYQTGILFIGVFVLTALESSSGYGLMGLFSFLGSCFGIWAAGWVGRQVDKGREIKILRQSVIWEAFSNFLRIVIGFLSHLGNIIALGLLFTLSWLPSEARSVSAYRRAYKQSDQFPDSRVEYSVCLENIGTFCRLILFGIACLLALVFDFRTTLLICLGLGFVINLIFLMKPVSKTPG